MNLFSASLIKLHANGAMFNIKFAAVCFKESNKTVIRERRGRGGITQEFDHKQFFLLKAFVSNIFLSFRENSSSKLWRRISIMNPPARRSEHQIDLLGSTTWGVRKVSNAPVRAPDRPAGQHNTGSQKS